MSQSDPWQTRFTNICQEIRNITHQSKIRKKHVLNKGVPKINYRDKIVSLDTHEGSARDGVYSDYNTPPDAESSYSSDTPEHYDTPIYNASLIPPSESPTPSINPLSDAQHVGLGRSSGV